MYGDGNAWHMWKVFLSIFSLRLSASFTLPICISLSTMPCYCGFYSIFSHMNFTKMLYRNLNSLKFKWTIFFYLGIYSLGGGGDGGGCCQVLFILHPIFIALFSLFFVAVDCKCHKFLSADGKNVPNISKAYIMEHVERWSSWWGYYTGTTKMSGILIYVNFNPKKNIKSSPSLWERGVVGWWVYVW